MFKRSGILLCIALCFCSCSGEKTPAAKVTPEVIETSKSMVDTPEIFVELHDISVQDSTHMGTPSGEPIAFPRSDSFTVKKLEHLASPDLLYAHLSLFDWDDWEKVDKLSRSHTSAVQHDNGETESRQFPTILAQTYFDLTDLDTVQLFDRNGRVNQVHYTGIHRIDDLLESFYAISYQLPPHPFDTSTAYLVAGQLTSGFTLQPGSWTFSDYDDPKKGKDLLKSLNIEHQNSSYTAWNINISTQPNYEYRIESMCLYPQTTVLDQSANGQKQASRISDDPEHGWVVDVIPTHLQYRSQPVWLFLMNVPETDALWYSAAAADSTGKFHFF